MSLRARLLQLALPLVNAHGFTRGALSRSVLSLPTPHSQPLSESAVSALFGEGNEARRTLINAWLESARNQMRLSPEHSMRDLLSYRLRQNEPVLEHLPEAFALLASPSGFPGIDPRPGIMHAAKVADEACYLSGDTTTGTLWYARRGTIAAVYAAAELHQMNSPETAHEFLTTLLDTSSKVETSLNETAQFASYFGRSWASIIKSREDTGQSIAFATETSSFKYHAEGKTVSGIVMLDTRLAPRIVLKQSNTSVLVILRWKSV